MLRRSVEITGVKQPCRRNLETAEFDPGRVKTREPSSASWLFSLLGISLGGWIGYLIAGFIGACILIAIALQSVTAKSGKG